MRKGEAHVEGIDGTVELVWRAIKKRAIGAYFLSRKEMRYILFAEDYLVKTHIASEKQHLGRREARLRTRSVPCLG